MILLGLSRNSISQVLRVTNLVVIHAAWHAQSLSILCLPCVLSTESISGTNHRGRYDWRLYCLHRP